MPATLTVTQCPHVLARGDASLVFRFCAASGFTILSYRLNGLRERDEPSLATSCNIRPAGNTRESWVARWGLLGDMNLGIKLLSSYVLPLF